MKHSLKGVYLEMPEELPQWLHHKDAVVVADPSTAAAAASRLRACGCRVTVLPADVELACIDGIGHVEALVVRRHGRLNAFNASAVFIL